MARSTITRRYSGRAEKPVEWEVLLRIFDVAWGIEARSLPRFPEVLGGVYASWRDASGADHEASALDEIEQAYQKHETAFISFSGHRFGSVSDCAFNYWPADAVVSTEVRAENQAIAELYIALVRKEFPIRDMARKTSKWDVFISHASEDKEVVAGPLAAALEKAGLAVWYDEHSLKLGDHLRRTIDQGLRDSTYGIIILSHSFFAKEWPQSELDGLIALETDGRQRIIPIWHDITHEEVLQYSPLLGDRLAISTDKGLDRITEEITEIVRGTSDPAGSASKVPEPTAEQAYASLCIHHPNNRTCSGKFLVANPGPRICNIMDISLLSDIQLPKLNLVSLGQWPGKSVRDDHTQKLPISIPVGQPKWVYFRTEEVTNVYRGDLPESVTVEIGFDRLKEPIRKMLKRTPGGHQYYEE